MSETASRPCVRQKVVIKAHEHVVIKTPSGGLRCVELKPGAVINLGKFGSFLVDGILGYRFGQSFEILEDQKVSPIKSLAFGLEVETNSTEENTPAPDDQLITKSSETNKDLNDLGAKIQGLSTAEIEQMKREGGGNAIGKAIIEKMIQSHDAFDKKTIFSQEKYLTRKQKKFTRRFTVLYMSSSNLLTYYYQEKDSQRVLDLSEETLGLMMNYGNIIPGGNYLLIDETGGLIAYTMLEKMKGQGTIHLLHENDQPNLFMLKQAGYSDEEVSKMIKPINWLQFTDPDNETVKVPYLTNEELSVLPKAKKQINLRRVKRALQINESVEFVKQNKFDAFISVSTLNPVTMVPKVIERLSGSRPIVVYSQYKEVLIECNHALNKDLRVLAPNIYQTKVRIYQTIPGKLHPLMTSRSGGGYLLYGIRVYPLETIQAVGRGSKRKKLNSEAAEVTKIEEVTQ